MHHYLSRKILKPAIAAIIFCYLSACVAPEDSLEKVAKSKQGEYRINTIHLDESENPQYTNRLIRQTSPYLLQHAHNPVDWWSWSDEAFAAAKAQDKPILLSIGYSTCHWCHVMERESFENIEIAEFINANFIPIKVDREEHPDIDETYLTAVQLLSGKVGWPLTAVLSPNADAFFGGTYFSPEQFLPLLKKIDDTWRTNRGAIDEQADRLKRSMTKLSQAASVVATIDSQAISEASQTIAKDIFSAPKYNQPGFPREPEMQFLLHRAILDGDAALLDSLEDRLIHLADSGIYDHVGGGFHRYAVDSQFKTPHFEKMLYNQAQLGQLFATASQFSNHPRLRKIGNQTLQFVLTELSNPNKNGFYSAMDAESSGVEGAYYVWRYSELKESLSEDELELLESEYGVQPQGQFNGSNVLALVAKAIEESPTEKELARDALLKKLSLLRQERTPPRVDTKVITAWNAMTISALIAGYWSDGNTVYRDRALAAASHIWSNSFSESEGLLRTQRKEEHQLPATLDDYAYLSNAYIDIYDLTKEEVWLQRSETLVQRMTKDFFDANTGAFYISDKANSKGLTVPMVTARDDALFSGNSMAAQSLARLFNRTGNIEYRNLARGIIAHFSTVLTKNPVSSSGLLLAASFLNDHESGTRVYAARGNVAISSTRQAGRITVNLDIKPGWHINANTVLSDFLIPTDLSADEASCASLKTVTYPDGKTVQLGFQSEPLLVYEGSVNVSAELLELAKIDQCNNAILNLKVQACSDEVCLSPERVPLVLGQPY